MKPLRTIVFREGDYYVAQVLEHDVCVRAKNACTLWVMLLTSLQRNFLLGENGLGLDHLKRAPNKYWAQWLIQEDLEGASRVTTLHDLIEGESGLSVHKLEGFNPDLKLVGQII
jgi:hypothetical protein